MTLDSFDTIVLGAGPAGMFAALRAADLGARTALVSSGPGTIPVAMVQPSIGNRLWQE